MTGTNKKLLALLVALILLLGVVILAMVHLFQSSAPSASGSSLQYIPAPTAASTDTAAALPQGTVSPAAGTTAAGVPDTQNTGAVANAVQTTGAEALNPASLSQQQILDLLTEAVNKTKGYTGTVSVHHTESFSANVTQCTGGSLVAQIANKLIGLVVKPSDETLVFTGGTAVNAQGETVPILLPQKGQFRLTMSGIRSLSAASDGGNTVISVALVPESVGMYEVPAANSAGVGYLDVASLDLSILEVTGAAIDYTGSTIQAVIRPNGYVESVEYTIPLHVEGSAKSGLISGSAVFDGMQTEVWDFNWE